MQHLLRNLVRLCGLLLVYNAPDNTEGEQSECSGSTQIKGYPCFLDVYDCLLDCFGMQLTSFPLNVPLELTAIDLTDNLITSIDYPTLANRRKLITLRLGNNRISVIGYGAFNDLAALYFLDLSNNNITTLEAETFYQLHNLNYFLFEGNPYYCSCSTLALKTWIGERNVTVDPALCHDTKGTEFWDYTDFSSCSAHDELFTVGLNCFDLLPQQDILEGSVSEDCPQEYKNPVCYTTLYYSDLEMVVTKGCMEDRECHVNAKRNTDTCYNTHGDRDCTFCCLHENCNDDTFGGRTKDLLFIADVLCCMDYNYNLLVTHNTSEFEIDFLDHMSVSLSDIPEFRGLANVKIDSISVQDLPDCNELTLICSIWYTTVIENDDQVMLETMNFTLATSFSNFRYLPHTVVVSLENGKEQPYCKAETIENEKGIFLWETTQGNTFATLYCIADTTAEMIPVTRECAIESGFGMWLPADTSECVDKINTLLDIAAANISDANADHIASKLYIISSNHSMYTAFELELAILALEELLLLESTFYAYERAQTVVQTIDRLLSVSISSLAQAEEKMNVAHRLLHLIDELTATVDVSERDFQVTGTELAAFAFKTSADEYLGASWILANTVTRSELNMVVFKNAEAVGDFDTYIRLPDTLISRLSNEEKDSVTRITGGIFTNAILFNVIEFGSGTKKDKSDLFQHITTVNSAIYTASVPGVKIQNLKEPVEFKVKQIQKNAKNPSCAYFAEGGMDKTWKEEGCYVKMHVPGNYTICACNHLTNFALLMDVYGTSAHISQGHRAALSILSYVGCVISLTGLTLTLLTYCLFRSLRTTRPALILMNLCGALVGLNIVFLIGEHDYVFNNEGMCKVVAAFLHYFLLAAIMWMLVEAFYFFMTIVLIWNSHIHSFFLKICVFGWGIPLLIVGVTGIVNNGRNYGLQGGGICWLDQPSFYGAVLTPLCAMLTINTGVFVTVLRRILGMHSKKLNKTEARQTSQRIRGSLTAIVMLGLTWGITIFAIGNNSASLIFQYLFAIFNSLQGFFIFLFHCLLKSEVQKVWSKMICKKKPVALGTSNGNGNMSTFNASTTPQKSD